MAAKGLEVAAKGLEVVGKGWVVVAQEERVVKEREEMDLEVGLGMVVTDWAVGVMDLAEVEVVGHSEGTDWVGVVETDWVEEVMDWAAAVMDWVVMVAAGREGVTEAGLRERWYFRVVSNECYSACHRPYFTQKDQKQGLKVLHTNHV